MQIIKSLSEATNLIKHYEKTFILNVLDIGKVLVQITEEKLYKQAYGTFEDYMKGNDFSFSESHAYNFMDIYRKYGQNLQRLEKIKELGGMRLLIASIKVENEYVDHVLEQIENKKIDKNEAVKIVNRMRSRAGKESHYSDSKSEHKLKLRRQLEVLHPQFEVWDEDMREDLKISYTAWLQGAKKFTGDPDFIILIKEVKEKIEKL